MPFDIAIFDEVISRLKRRTPSPPGSVRVSALKTHEILGGEGDRKPIFGRGYFLVWARGLPHTPASQIEIIGRPNTPVADPPSVTVKDAANQPIPGFPLRFTVKAGGGFLDGSECLTVVDIDTDATGTATVKSWTLGPSPGANQVVAEGFSVERTFNAIAVLTEITSERTTLERSSKK